MAYFSMLESAFYSKEERFVNEVLDLSYTPGCVITESEKQEFLKDPARFAMEIEETIQLYKETNDKKKLFKIIGLIGLGLTIMMVAGAGGGVIPIAIAKAVIQAADFAMMFSIGYLIGNQLNKKKVINNIQMIEGLLEYDNISKSDKDTLEKFKVKLEKSLEKKDK